MFRDFTEEDELSLICGGVRAAIESAVDKGGDVLCCEGARDEESIVLLSSGLTVSFITVIVLNVSEIEDAMVLKTQSDIDLRDHMMSLSPIISEGGRFDFVARNVLD